MSKDFSLQQLRLFVAVAEELHFRRAAERVHLSQPPLTRQVRALEDSLGVTLLERTSRRVNLTPAGVVFLEEARRVLSAVDQARRAAVRAETGQLGSIIVGFIESAALDLLPQVLPRFRDQFTDLDLELREMHTSEQCRQLHERRIDVGILRPPVDEAGLEVTVLHANPLVAVLPEDHPLASGPVALADLAGEAFVMYSRRLGEGIYSAILQSCLAVGFTPRVRHEATSTPMLMSLVAAREGVALVPEQFAFTRRIGVRFAPVDDAAAMSSVAIAWRTGDSQPAYQALCSIARQVAGKLKQPMFGAAST
ncbi:LysR substrate-binding domain-containing protein [Microtetraspora malaysiensis]|uniref:LysR family transcriptional regulator n=1 Tax=Microtetraspora malaysiensis TaxID=161358 RepID=UPI003D8CD294